ncbi:MAG TPA: hypothetical protein VNN22_24025 [Verrucomicrobiae bacterium]|nr:hypothetical protein [Verrucomicrobiae bacterium]
MFIVAWRQGGNLRWTVLPLSLVFVIFAMFISVVWSTTHSDPGITLARWPAASASPANAIFIRRLMSWFVAGFVLLVSAAPDKPVPPPEPRAKPPAAKPGRRRH